MAEPIRIQYDKTADEHSLVDELGKKTKITGLPPTASMKAVKARAKAMGLKVKKDK